MLQKRTSHIFKLGQCSVLQKHTSHILAVKKSLLKIVFDGLLNVVE
jgi:hypothetical protein